MKFKVTLLLIVILGLATYIGFQVNHASNFKRGYLRVYVRWGEKNNNSPIEGAEIKVIGEQNSIYTNMQGYTPSIPVSTNLIDPKTNYKVGNYTVIVSKSGAEQIEYHNVVVIGGTTESAPTTLDVFMTHGNGREIIELPTNVRNSPQTQGK